MTSNGIDVTGRSAQVTMSAFGSFATLASQFMLEAGIGREGPNKLLQLEPEGWYPLGRFLTALGRIQERLGPTSLYQVGMSVPRHAIMPEVKSLQEALGMTDIAYHMNHRKDGKPMFNPESGSKLEGIGHYGYEEVPRKNLILCVCTSLYPCDFDLGLLTGIAKMGAATALTTHDASRPCRKNGGESCTYQVTWF